MMMSEQWNISQWGNYWRDFDDLRVTLFKRKDGWRYCIASGMGPTFSRQAWPTLREAKQAVYQQLRKINVIA